MGCSCKQNRPQTKTKVVNNETIIQEEITLETLIGDGVPPFTRQEVQRAQDYLNGITNSYEEKTYLYEFHNKYHRETLQPSCAVCLPRIQDRINQMGKILDNYDKANR
jgi:hypothetical protein